MRFIPLASSSRGNAYIVQDDGVPPLLLEAGLPIKQLRDKLRSYGVMLSDLAGCLVSHEHQDHAKAVKDLLRAGVDIFASKETFSALGLSGHRLNEINEGQFSVGTWRILPFKTIHDIEGSLGFYMVNQKKEAFLYLTDSAYSPVRFKDLNVIAIECNFVGDILSKNILSNALPAIVGRRVRRSHFSLENVISLLKANDLSSCRQIFLLHLSDGNADEQRMVQEIQSATGIPTETCGK